MRAPAPVQVGRNAACYALDLAVDTELRPLPCRTSHLFSELEWYEHGADNAEVVGSNPAEDTRSGTIVRVSVAGLTKGF